jgi:ubiquinone/menaquinone biosynthesis C-methylase UbiE
MDIKPGMTVADIGTGVGYMLPFLSSAVGPSGKVYGEDIQTDFLDRAKAKKAANVELILGTETDPKLPAGAVDVALVLDVYHHFDYPDKMLAAIRRGLKPGAHLVIVDFYKSASPSPGHIRLERDDVVAEVEGNGFHLLAKRDHTPNSQYMLTFEKK